MQSDDSSETRPRFHLAFAVDDLAAARKFYGGLLGCREGRSSERWIDFDFFGHQLVAHLVEEKRAPNARNPVDGDDVPVPHFGVILEWETFDVLAARLQEANLAFIIAPRVRFAGKPGAQKTMFFVDPSGNALEMKAFQREQDIFAR